MRMKKFFTLVLSAAFMLNSSMLSFATTKNVSSDNNIITKQEITEIQDYMKSHQTGLELEDQTQTYNVPLSSGENAIVEITLTKKGYSLYRDIYTAKLGKWDIDYNAKIPHKGSIKLRASFNVTHVPDMNSSNKDMVKFNVTGSSISAVPPQGASIIDKGSSYKTVYTNSEYSISGYTSFSISGNTMNYYVDMLMYSKTNTGSERNKIYVDTNLSV